MLRLTARARHSIAILFIILATSAPSITSAGPAVPDGTRAYLPLVVQSAHWVTLLTENFEAVFPGGWQVYDAYPGSGHYHWGQRSCRSYGDGASAWAVGGGTDGTALACGSQYPGNASSWLVLGPFSLADATGADLSYMLWADLAPEAADYFFVGASIDGSGFYGQSLGGNSGGWTERTLDLANIITLGDLTGQPQVWIGFVFASGASGSRAEGVYIDDIVLRKLVGR